MRPVVTRNPPNRSTPTAIPADEALPAIAAAIGSSAAVEDEDDLSLLLLLLECEPFFFFSVELPFLRLDESFGDMQG